METITIDKKIFIDLVKISEELNDKLESLELANDPEFMESLKKSKEQIKNGDLVEFDNL